MDQATIDEWEKDTPKNIPERVEKVAGFYTGFEKRALSTGAKVGLGLGATALGGLGVAKAVQPYDVTHQFNDVTMTNSKKGEPPPVHMTVSKKRPLFFGRSKHMALAKDPKKMGIFGGDPIRGALMGRRVATGMGGDINYTPQHRQAFLEMQRKKKFVSQGGVPLDDNRTGALYDKITLKGR